MRLSAAIAAVFAVSVLCSSVSAEDIPLPEVKKDGGPSLLKAIDQRGSAGQSAFPSRELSREDLAVILWAATGNNRGGSKWTVPMAQGKQPYCKIYLTLSDGVYLYNWEKHALTRISGKDVRKDIPMQQFAKDAPASVYIVSDGKGVSAFPEPLASEGGPLLAGAMSQNIYLACQAVDAGVRLIYSINRSQAASEFKLAPGDTVLFAMPMGKN